MRHVNLRPTLGDSIQQVQANVTRKASTRPHGVKVMSEGDDVVWTNEAGEESSVRKVDAAMVELDATMAETRTDLATLNDTTLPELQAHLEQQIGNIVVSGGGNLITSSPDAPGTGDAGKTEGDTWFQILDGKTVGQWIWSGTKWDPVTLESAVIANVDVSKLTASSASLGTAVVNKLFADIFSANKISAGQINADSVAGAVGNFLELKAEQVTSGSFVGEKFSGGLFEGATFRTSDPKPGSVTFSETAFGGSPGISIEPTDSASYDGFPGIGPYTLAGLPASGITVSGGSYKTGPRSGFNASPELAQLHWGDYSSKSGPGAWVTLGRNDASITYAPSKDTAATRSTIRVNADACLIRRDDAGGATGLVSASPANAEVSAWSSSGLSRFRANEKELYLWREKRLNGKAITQDIFAFDDGGLTYKQAAWDTSGNQLYNRWTKFGDSGWINVTPGSGIKVGEQLAYRIVNSVCYWRGIVYGSSSSSTLAAGTTTIMTIPATVRPESVQLRPTATNAAVHLFLEIQPDGRFTIWSSASTAGWVHINGMSYALG